MAFRSGVYIVPTNRWYIERAVWLVAGARWERWGRLTRVWGAGAL